MLDKTDLHTHTLVSGHAYNTRNEMSAAAWERGLEVYAITEHAPAMPGSCHSIYFMNYRALSRKHKEMTVLYGAELNILDYEGHVDLPEIVLQDMDLTLASIHMPCYLAGTVKENTKAYLNAMKNPYVNLIAHADDVKFPIEYEALVEGAKKYHVILEVNNASLTPGSFRGNPREQYAQMLKLCKEYEVPIAMNSDAHVDLAVGKHEYAQEVLDAADFPQELVVNYNPQILKTYLNYYKKSNNSKS
ncbi:MAG: phosphatase [Lachnospiraceae bacterium]